MAVKLAGLEEAQFFVGNVEQRFGVSEEQYVGYLACAYEVDYPVSASLRQGCIGNFASTVCDLLRLPARDVVIVFTPVSQPDA